MATPYDAYTLADFEALPQGELVAVVEMYEREQAKIGALLALARQALDTRRRERIARILSFLAPEERALLFERLGGGRRNGEDPVP